MAEKSSKKRKKKKSEYYVVKDNKIERKKLFCPKCGAGVFLAEHADRFTCGKCSFTQWKQQGDKK
jgi:small subunit ribosomal protein S27Ae